MIHLILEVLACILPVFVAGMLAFILCATFLLVWEALARFPYDVSNRR